MKSRLFVVLLVAAAISLVSESALQAGCTEIWNSGSIATISQNTLPRIAGECLVWQARGGLGGAVSGSGDWEVFLYNISTDTVIQVTDDDYADFSPQTDGDYVVWQKHDPVRTNQVFLYKVHGVNPPGGSMISKDDDKDKYSPQIAAGRVVWTSQRVAHSFEPGQIMLYDVKNPGPPESISDSTFNCSSPQINSETVIWIQSDGNGDTTLFMYDLTSANPEPVPAPEDLVWPGSPQADGNLTVSTRHDGTDREIVVYNKQTKVYEQMTNNDFDDTYPRISENHIAWVAGEEIFLGAYTCLILVSPTDGAILSRLEPSTFMWESIGCDKFKVEFCGNPHFSTTDVLAFPSQADTWLSGMSYAPTEDEWHLVEEKEGTDGIVYWRVNGNTGLSDSCQFTFAATIDADDGTDSDGRVDSDGGGHCFIGTAASGAYLDPLSY
jgi:hypothetical protein